MVVVYLPAPIFNRPMPLMRAGGSREETDISLIKIDSIHCLPSFFSKSEVLLAALSSSSSSPFPPLMVLRCGESISFSFSGIRERIGIVGIQVDKCTSGPSQILSTQTQRIHYRSTYYTRAGCFQRPKNLGGMVALPSGKFLRVRKVFARNP